MRTLLKIGILGSTRGSNLLPLRHALEKKNLPINIAVVISNQENAGILERAKEQQWPAFYIASQQLTREAYDHLLTQKLQEFDVDLIVLMGYMRILSNDFITQWQHRIINAHPSLLPAFSGKMDKAVHQAVLDAKLTETGCTVHEVNETVDGGPILVQKKCPVYTYDNIDSLKTRVQALEVEAFAEAIQTFYKEIHDV